MMNKLALIIIMAILPGVEMKAQEYERYKKLLDTTIYSSALGHSKNLTVTVPFEWQKNMDRDFPLTIIFDRQNSRSHQYILNTIDYLTSTEMMPSTVIISVESDDKHRYHETLHQISKEIGKAAQNELFIFNELIPMAEEHFKASSYRLFIGHSRYGYFTTSLLFSRPNEINAVISLSPFFSQKNVELIDSVALLEQMQFEHKKYYRFGIGNDYPEDFRQMDSVLQTVDRQWFDAKGVLYPKADHNATPGLTIAPALYEVFEYWSETQLKYFHKDQTDLSIIPSLEQEIFDHYGSDIKFSLGYLNGKGWFFYNAGEYENAILAWQLLIDSYPNFSAAYLYMMYAESELENDFSSTKELFIESLELSTIYSEDEKDELLKELAEILKNR